MRMPATRPGTWAAPAAALLTLAVDILYVAIVHGQGEPLGSRVVFVAASLAAAALAVVWPGPPAARAGLLAWAVTSLVVWTLLGIASIGLLLAPAAALAVVAGRGVGAPGRRGLAAVVAGTAGAVLTAAFGLAWTS